MNYPFHSHLRLSLVIAGLLALPLPLPLHAAPLTWSCPSGGTWDTTTAANRAGTTWNSATPDDAIFGATGMGKGFTSDRAIGRTFQSGEGIRTA